MLLLNGLPLLVNGLPANGGVVSGVAPTISGVPTISGTAQVGQTLTASAASYSAGTPTPTTTWQWVNSVSGNIGGATSSTYTLQASDEGDTITVVQTGTNASGSDTATSSATSTVAAASGSVDVRFGTTNTSGEGTYDHGSGLTNGTYATYFTVTSGRYVALNSTPAAGTYDVSGLTVEVSSDYFAVNGQTQFDALTSGEYGKTVVIRQGSNIIWDQASGDWGQSADMNWTVVTSDEADARTWSYEGATDDSKAHFDYIILDRTAKVAIQDLGIVAQDPATQATTIELRGTENNKTAAQCENVEIIRCLIKSSAPTPNGDYTGGTSSFPGGKGILSQFTMYPRGTRIIDNVIHGTEEGVLIGVGDWFTEIVGNEIQLNYSDFLKPNKMGSEDVPMLIAGNYMSRPMAIPTDSGGPHSDIMQCGDINNWVFEANFFFSGDSRGKTGIQVMYMDSNTSTTFKMRGHGHIDTSSRSYSPESMQNSNIEYCATIPSESAPTIPYGSGEAALLVQGTTSNNHVSNSFFGAYATSGATETNLAQLKGFANEAAVTAALPAYPIADTDGPYTMAELLDLFAVTGGGALDGMGPTHMVSLADGVERSAFTMDNTLVPTPTLSSASTPSGSTSFSSTVQTDVDLDPIFWAVVPTGTSVTDPMDIKYRKISAAVDYGYSIVPKGSTATNITLTGTSGALTSSTTYDLVMFQANGWSKQSAITTKTFTTS